MMIVAVLGLLINVLVLWIMTRGETDHVNVKGAILHVMGDLLGSVGAIVAAIVIYFTGWTPIDPILSVLVAALILRSAWKLLAKSIHILLEGAPEDASPEKVEQGLMSTVPGLAAVSHVHVWQLTSGRTMATADRGKKQESPRSYTRPWSLPIMLRIATTVSLILMPAAAVVSPAPGPGDASTRPGAKAGATAGAARR